MQSNTTGISLEEFFEKSSNTILAVTDNHGNFVHLNQAWEHLLGYTKDELLGKSFISLVYPDDVEHTNQEITKALKSQRQRNFENRYICKNESTIWLSWDIKIYPDRQEHCFIARDITPHKMTEMQLLMRNQAIKHSPTGISIADARLPDLPLIYINPAFEKNTGYSAINAIGRNCRFLQNDDRNQEGIHIIREAIRNEESAQVIIRNYRKDGKMFYNELGLAPIHNDEGELTHYVGITTDVTERIEAEAKIQKQNQDLMLANANLARARKQAEEATVQVSNQNQALIIANRDLAIARKQAEEATRLKSQFLATMSHELRTPLNAIIGYTEIQLAGMTGKITEEQRDYQERVVINAEHLLNLINDVLDISKIEAGRLELVEKIFNLREWLSDLDNQMRGLADDKSLELKIILDERMPEMIAGDPDRMKQVVINLLSNAIKFTEEGHIHMSIHKHENDTWHIIVEDTGIGIAAHKQETIFEAFRQVDSSSRRKTGGTGLGLAIVRKLTLMMGGTTHLNSELGNGSTFIITLPLQTKQS